ncbi:hypothetical protein HY416_01750 [Candidatus Kaiserbacteria bacterium]|nr:hypothetical protein [Candidatus Kaiserbacteria bacterium]
MIEKRSIFAIAKHILRRSEGHADRRIMHPARDWLIGLFVAAALFLSVGGGTGYLYWYKSSEVTEAYDVAIEEVSYDQKLITRTLEKYRVRKRAYESLGGNVSAVVPDADEEVATSTATSTKPTSIDETVAE